MKDRPEMDEGRVEGKTRLLRVNPEPPAEALVFAVAGLRRGPTEVERSAARAAAAEAAALAEPVAAVRWLGAADAGWLDRVAPGVFPAVDGCAAVVLTLGPRLEEKVTADFAGGRLSAGVWLEAAANALLAQATARLKTELFSPATEVLWLAPGCHELPVESLAELVGVVGGAAVGVGARPGGGLSAGKAVAGLLVRTAASEAGRALRTRLAQECAACASRWCPGRAGGTEVWGQP